MIWVTMKSRSVNKDERGEGTTSGMVIGTLGNPDVFRLNPVYARKGFS